ncbi:hypothetical protein V8F20_006102 [Naviculisporaceae sp. PSN 640]
MEPFIYTTFALSKAAVLCFLHRLSKVHWQRMMLLALAVLFTSWSISIGVLITFVIFQGLYVPHVEILTTYFGFTVFLNFFLAMFPWYMFRRVQMKPSKKTTICLCLGLAGVLGGIACLVRNIKSITVQNDDNHLVDVQIWTCWEIGVTILAVCIPTLRPLFKRWRRRLCPNHLNTDKQTAGGSPGPSDPFERIERGYSFPYISKTPSRPFPMRRRTTGPGPDTQLIHETATSGVRTNLSGNDDDQISPQPGDCDNHGGGCEEEEKQYAEHAEHRTCISTREFPEQASTASSSDGNLPRPSMAHMPGNPLRHSV